MLSGVRGWNNRMNGRKVGEENLHYPLEMGGERTGRLQQAVCCRAGGQTGRGKGEDLQLDYLFPQKEWPMGNSPWHLIA